MKTLTLIALTAIVAFSAGCSSQQAGSPASTDNAKAVQVAYDLGSITKGDIAHCVVCVAEGTDHGEEPAASTINYKGKTYAFCNEGEKATFISDPDKFTKIN